MTADEIKLIGEMLDNKLDAKLKPITHKLDELDTKVDNLEIKVDSLDTKVKSLDIKVSKLEVDVTQIKKDTGIVADWVDSVDKKVRVLEKIV